MNDEQIDRDFVLGHVASAELNSTPRQRHGEPRPLAMFGVHSFPGHFVEVLRKLEAEGLLFHVNGAWHSRNHYRQLALAGRVNNEEE